jgi:hypothetical protein
MADPDERDADDSLDPAHDWSDWPESRPDDERYDRQRRIGDPLAETALTSEEEQTIRLGSAAVARNLEELEASLVSRDGHADVVRPLGDDPDLATGHPVDDEDAAGAGEVERLRKESEDILASIPRLIEGARRPLVMEVARLRAAIAHLLATIDDDHRCEPGWLCVTCGDVGDGRWPCKHRVALDEMKATIGGEAVNE